MSLLVLTARELEDAAALLAGGAVVAVPTDTVYGFAARLGDDEAVARLFAAKRRPGSSPVAVLCATGAGARAIATSWPPSAERLAERFWPGPLTVVVDADPSLVDRLGATRGAGVRVPNDATCRALLALTGPLAVTSANLHGEPPATTAGEVARSLAVGVAAVVDDGVRGGAVSTVVDLTGADVLIVREGAISTRDVLGTLSGA